MEIRVDGKAARVKVSPELYGIFYEEINHAGEGGLYAEMVQNRDFEANQIPVETWWAGNLLQTPKGWRERKWFANELHGWSLIAEGGAKGSIRQESVQPMSEQNPHSMRLLAVKTGKRFGVTNYGFWGMNFQAGHTYDLVFHARTEGEGEHDLTVSLESTVGHEKYATKMIKRVGGPWKKYKCTLTVTGSDPRGRLAIVTDRPGSIWFDFVSLFPRKTFKNRKNGMRPDVAKALADLEPGFLRFPGGCVVEGLTLSNRIQWKNSIGPVDRRLGTVSVWAYYNTNGIGFHEYLQLAEDLGAEAIYVINAGLSCQGRCPEVCKPEELDGYVQETLDALEYAMGPADSTWGSLRAANGRPEPFTIKYVEIGNENGGDDYSRHYKVFYQAIKASYPDIITIADNRNMGDATVEMIDDHYYSNPDFFFENEGRYDSADRKGSAIYVGEYACNSGVGHGNLLGALSEAAFMIGMERNSDIVKLCSYAPLFFNVNDISWPVNLIGFDSSRVVGRSSYHVQRLFGQHRPDEVLPTTVDGPTAPKTREVYALAGLDQAVGELVLKMVNRSAAPRAVDVVLAGLAAKEGNARAITLSHADPTAENSLDDPDVVAPVESSVTLPGEVFSYTLPAYSLTILRIPLKG